MTDVIKKIKQKFEDEADEVMELRNDLLLNKTDLNMKMLGILLRKFVDSVDEILADKESDKRLDIMGESMKSVLEEIKEAVQNIKIPELQQQINFDTKPLTLLAENIGRHNREIIDLLKKVPESKNDNLSRELMAMIARNNEFISRAVQQVDYTAVLNSIAENVKREDGTKVVEKIIVNRDSFSSLIKEIVPIYK